MKQAPNPALSRPAFGGGVSGAKFANLGYTEIVLESRKDGGLRPLAGPYCAALAAAHPQRRWAAPHLERSLCR